MTALVPLEFLLGSLASNADHLKTVLAQLEEDRKRRMTQNQKLVQMVMEMQSAADAEHAKRVSDIEALLQHMERQMVMAQNVQPIFPHDLYPPPPYPPFPVKMPYQQPPAFMQPPPRVFEPTEFPALPTPPKKLNGNVTEFKPTATPQPEPVTPSPEPQPEPVERIVFPENFPPFFKHGFPANMSDTINVVVNADYLEQHDIHLVKFVEYLERKYTLPNTKKQLVWHVFTTTNAGIPVENASYSADANVGDWDEYLAFVYKRVRESHTWKNQCFAVVGVPADLAAVRAIRAAKGFYDLVVRTSDDLNLDLRKLTKPGSLGANSLNSMVSLRQFIREENLIRL